MGRRKIFGALMIVSALVLLMHPVSGAADASPGRPDAVPGEKLDSGLGQVSGDYASPAQQRQAATGRADSDRAGHHVPGEKLDSGLGELAPLHPPVQSASNAR